MAGPQPTGSDNELFAILDAAWTDGDDLEHLSRADLLAWRDAAVARHLAQAGAVHPEVHTPARVQNWLEQHGWRMHAATDVAALWAHPDWPGLHGWSLRLPLLTKSVNYVWQVTASVQHAAMVGGIDAERVLLEISQMPDEVAW